MPCRRKEEEGKARLRSSAGWPRAVFLSDAMSRETALQRTNQHQLLTSKKVALSFDFLLGSAVGGEETRMEDTVRRECWPASVPDCILSSHPLRSILPTSSSPHSSIPHVLFQISLSSSPQSFPLQQLLPPSFFRIQAVIVSWNTVYCHH